MKTNWLMAAGAAAALLVGGVAYAGDLSPAELDPLVKSGRVLPLDELEAAVLAKHHGGKVKKGEIEHKNGGYIYEAEMTDRDGEDWDVYLDATTGLLLKEEKD
jgi:uncharacterized membrane protein YkoI